MKLITKALKFPKLYETDGKPKDEVKVIAKYFTPDANTTFYATEFDGADTFFGYVDHCNQFGGELGYFSLSELQSIRGRFGLPVERDQYFNATLAEVMNGTKS